MVHTTIKLGGEERALRFDLNALEVIGEKLGVKVRIAHIGEDLLNYPFPLGSFKVILWAGLLWKEPDLTPQQVGSWVVAHENMLEVMEYFFDLFSVTSPDLRARVKQKIDQGEDLVLAEMM